MKKTIGILFIIAFGMVTGFTQSEASGLLTDCEKVGKSCKGLDGTCQQMVMGCYENEEKGEPGGTCSPNICGCCFTTAPDECEDY